MQRTVNKKYVFSDDMRMYVRYQPLSLRLPFTFQADSKGK